MLKISVDKLAAKIIALTLLFVVGCEDKYEPIVYDFELYTESLTLDDNGYFHFDLEEGIANSFTSRTLFVANLNNPNIQKVVFSASHYWLLGDTLGYIVHDGYTENLVYVSYDTTYITQFNGFEVPIINSASYTNTDGLAFSWAAIPYSMVGDTIYIKAEYFDEYEWLEYEKTIGVVVE